MPPAAAIPGIIAAAATTAQAIGSAVSAHNQSKKNQEMIDFQRDKAKRLSDYLSTSNPGQQASGLGSVMNPSQTLGQNTASIGSLMQQAPQRPQSSPFGGQRPF